MENKIQDKDIFNGELLKINKTNRDEYYIVTYPLNFDELEYIAISKALKRIYGAINIRFATSLSSDNMLEVIIIWYK